MLNKAYVLNIIEFVICSIFLHCALFLNVAVVNAEETFSAKEIYKQHQDAVGVVLVTDKDNKPISQGSGFFISEDGYFVTNIHVIENGENFYVKLRNGAFFIVTNYLSYDKNADIIILKLDGKNLPFLELGDSYQLEIGDEVMAIGSPRGLENTISPGVVSAIRESEDKAVRIIQTNAEVSPGNSGGPLLNMKGKVIGVTTFIIGNGEGLTFAVSVENIKEALNKQEAGHIDETTDFERSPEYCYYLGIISKDAGNYEVAKDCFAKSIELNERFDKPYYELGELYYQSKQFKEEKAVYEKLVNIRYMDAEAHYEYALALENNGEEVEAIREYKTALKFDPIHQDCLFNLGFLYILNDNYGEAEKIVNQLRPVNERWTSQLERLLNKLMGKE
ncbi:MAG: trypsin-like peptidase domain-containing protein [Candidatus Omnitrophota bacterium]